MKILITESQKDNVLKKSIRDNGIEFTSNFVGGIDNLFKLLDINSAMDFLHLFDGLELVRSVENPYWVLFRFKPNHNYMVYDTKNDKVYVNYDGLWSFLLINFKMEHNGIRNSIKKWLSDVHNLKGVEVKNDYGKFFQHLLGVKSIN